MKARVLFVDDDELLVSAMQRIHRRTYHSATATSPADALRLLAEESPFDVIVSDHQMPQGTGAELLHQVRELYPDVGRILLSGNLALPTIVEATKNGDIDVALTKPCSREELNEAIAQLVGERHPTDPAP